MKAQCLMLHQMYLYFIAVVDNKEGKTLPQPKPNIPLPKKQPSCMIDGCFRRKEGIKDNYGSPCQPLERTSPDTRNAYGASLTFQPKNTMPPN